MKKQEICLREGMEVHGPSGWVVLTGNCVVEAWQSAGSWATPALDYHVKGETWTVLEIDLETRCMSVLQSGKEE